MAGPGSDTLQIHVPASAEHFRDVRAFVAAAARHRSWPEETVEDLRLLATETCSQAIDEEIADRGIDVRVRWDGDAMVVEIEPLPAFADDTDEELDPTSGTRRWALIEALFPSAERETSDAARVLRVRIAEPDPSPR